MSKKKIIFLFVIPFIVIILVGGFFLWQKYFDKRNIPANGRTDAEILKELESFPTMTKESLSSEHPLYKQVKTEKEIIEGLQSL